MSRIAQNKKIASIYNDIENDKSSLKEIASKNGTYYEKYLDESGDVVSIRKIIIGEIKQITTSTVTAKKYSYSYQGADFKEIANSIRNGSTKLETLRNTVRYLRDHYQWNRHTAVQSFNLASEFLKKKTGNTADFNIVLDNKKINQILI